MKQVYENVMKVFDEEKANGKVWVSYFDNVQQALANGFDKETLDEVFYIWGKKDILTSDLDEQFIMIEEQGATDLPIFTEDSKHEVMHYLEDNYSEYLEGN